MNGKKITKVSQLLSLLLVLCACSSPLVPKSPYQPNDEALNRALSGELLLGQPVRIQDLPEVDIFLLTPEMKAFAEKAIAKHKRPDKKAEALHYALMETSAVGGRGITYTADMTGTGVQAFEQREANCLSYTLLYTAMARHVGLDAQVNEVLLPPTWDMKNANSYLFMRHVNVKVIMPKAILNFAALQGGKIVDVGDVIVDLELRRFRNRYQQTLIDDEQTAAQYYNNRGMELSSSGDQKNAFLHLRKALNLTEDAHYIWGNLGTFYRRQGFIPEAEAAYLKGLSLNQNDYSIMHNLTGLYKETGNILRYQEFQQKVRAHRNANPYFIYVRAQNLMKEGSYNKAQELIEKAIEINNKEPRFYRIAAEIYGHLGDDKKSAKMRKKYEELMDKEKLRII